MDEVRTVYEVQSVDENKSGYKKRYYVSLLFVYMMIIAVSIVPFAVLVVVEHRSKGLFGFIAMILCAMWLGSMAFVK